MKRNIALYTIIGLAAVLSSCVVGKKYQRADLQVPATYREGAALTADSVVLPWRTFFRDPQLLTLIDSALLRNNDVSVAVKNMEQLDLAFRQARLGLLPTLNLAAGANRSWQSKNSLNGSLAEQFTGSHYIDDYSASLQMSWEADIWGKVKMQKESARADYLAQQQNLAALKTRLIVQVAQAYYNLAGLNEQLLIAQKNMLLSDSTLQIMKLQFTAGQINSLAVEQAEAQKKTAELLVPLYQQNIRVQENALSILCGRYPEAVNNPGKLQDVLPAALPAAGIPANLLSRRPDLKAAELAVVTANAKTGLAKAAMYPSFSLSPQIGVNSYKIDTWFDLPGSITKTVAINLSQPLFQKRALKTAYKTALIEQEKAAVQFKAAMMSAVAEVSDALARAEGASKRVTLAEQRNASLDKATADALKLYKSGMATYLEVITAQNNKLQNEIESISIQLEKLNAYSDLYRSLGGGIR